jgi:lipid-binding SYLF domain-containing protein
LFAGINLSGGVVKPDPDDDADLYGSQMSAESIVTSPTLKPPAVVEPFMSALRHGV